MEAKEFLKEKNIESSNDINLISLLEEYSEMRSNDKYIRLYADFENYKKRTAKEKADIEERVKSNLLSPILDIDNDLSIALKSLSNIDGLDIIINKFKSFLKSNGIEEIQTDSYDQELHDVAHIIYGDGEDKVSSVISKGYTINGKVIRYPKIILSK